MKTTRALRQVGCLSFVLASAIYSDARGQCQTGASSVDADLFNALGCDFKYPGTNTWFPLVYYKRSVWDVLARSGWSDRGFNDACNIGQDFTKHWQSAALLEAGLADDLQQQMHGDARHN